MSQDTLIIIGLLAGVLLIGAVVFVILRRRRAAQDDSLPLPEIGQSVDYTSLPVVEPQTLGERFRAAPPAVKLLAVLAPIALIGIIAALALTFGPAGEPPPTPTPPPPPPQMTIVRAEVVGSGRIVVVVDTANLPTDAVVSATLLEDSQEFAWFVPDTAIARPDSLTGQAQVTLDRREGAPTPRQDANYVVVAFATNAGGELIRTEATPLNVLPIFVADFFALAPEPTNTAVASAVTPTPRATATIVATQAVTVTEVLTGTATIGGNIRREPSRDAEVLGQMLAGETVSLTERSVDGEWYRVTTDAGVNGWVSRTLLTVDQERAARLPVATPDNLPRAVVFNGGNVRTSPNLNGAVIDQVNAGEEVQLLAKNDGGTWLKIINERTITGWVSRTLLTISLEDLDRLPVSSEAAPLPLPATSSALPPQPTPNATVPPTTGLTAIVFNGGNVRASPNLQGQVLDQINARETVELLSKTPDGDWYRIRNVRGVTGWVNRTLLTVDPDVAQRVPVGQ